MASKNLSVHNWYFILFCGVILIDFLLIVSVELAIIEPFFVIIIAIGISLSFIIYIAIRPIIFKDYPYSVSYSILFVILPWLLYGKAILEKNTMIDLILNEGFYFIIIFNLLPIIIRDIYFFRKRNELIKAPKIKLENLKLFLRKNVFFIFSFVTIILSYIFIWAFYYNILLGLQLLILNLILISIMVSLYIINFSFLKRNIPSTIYIFSFSAILLLYFVEASFDPGFIEFMTFDSILLLFFIFLIILPIIGIIELLIFRSAVLKEKITKKESLKDYKSIPNLTQLIRNYVYNQLKSLKQEFKTIQIENLDEIIKNQLNSKLAVFLNYLKLEGYELSKLEVKEFRDDCFKESEPIRNELKSLLKKEMSKELFGEEVVKEEIRSIDNRIDELLKGFQDWELSKEYKKP